jgi:hypothetical protein
MQESKKPSISLWVGLLAIGLTFLSVYASADVGRESPRNEEERALETISRALGTHYEPNAYTDKKNQCSVMVDIAKVNDGDPRSEEELMNICLSLPPSHADSCGFPANPGEYFELKDQQCVSKVAGIQMHAHARKVEARDRPVDSGEEYNNGGDGDDGTGTTRGAQ